MCGRHTLIRNTSYSSSLPLPCFGIWCFRNWLKTLLSSPPWDPVAGCVGMAQSCTRGGSDWTLGSISSLRGCQTLKQASSSLGAAQGPRPGSVWGIGTISFSFWSAMNWVRQLDEMVTVGTFPVKNIIFYPLVGLFFRTGTILDCQVYSIFF